MEAKLRNGCNSITMAAPLHTLRNADQSLLLTNTSKDDERRGEAEGL